MFVCAAADALQAMAGRRCRVTGPEGALDAVTGNGLLWSSAARNADAVVPVYRRAKGGCSRVLNCNSASITSNDSAGREVDQACGTQMATRHAGRNEPWRPSRSVSGLNALQSAWRPFSYACRARAAVTSCLNVASGAPVRPLSKLRSSVPLNWSSSRAAEEACGSACCLGSYHDPAS